MTLQSPLPVRIDDRWYDLASFDHPGGRELLERHAGADITHLFYSNHFVPSTEPLHDFLSSEYGGGCPVTAAAHSPLYRELKRAVKARLAERRVEWRHTFSYTPYLLRLACLTTCLAARLLDGSGGDEGTAAAGAAAVAATIAAATYGLLTGRQTWTHAHNGVHNPARIPSPMRSLLRLDFVGVVEVWMLEHHAHHSFTNGEADPDAKWWQPLFSYHELAASGGSRTTAALALLIYPFLVPVMLVKSLGHMLSHDPDGRDTLRWVLLVAPLRFAIDIAVLGPANFGVAIGAATVYILATFVATHQAGAYNHAFDADDCWMVRQLRATNNVWSRSAWWTRFCGGINLHIEHHLFPHVSNDQLHHIAPLVEAFAHEHGLPYRTFSPGELAKEHAAFLGGRDAVESR